MERRKASVASCRGRLIKGSIHALGLVALIVPAAQTSAAGAEDASTTAPVASEVAGVEGGRFRCPETLLTLAEKTREMERFLSWPKKRHPSWTLGQISTFRIAVLQNNNCIRTLENIQAPKSSGHSVPN